MSEIILSKGFIRNSVKLALNEDLYPNGDITSNLTQKGNFKTFKIIANQDGIVGGIEFAKSTFKIFDNKVQFLIKKKDGSQVKKGQIIAIISKGDKEVKRIADYTIEVPDSIESITPFITVIPLQLLSYHIAVMLGKNVDQPRNLAKSVTVE